MTREATRPSRSARCFDRSTLDLRENNFGGFGTSAWREAGHRLPGHGLAWTVASRRAIGTLNGGGGLLYNQQNEPAYRISNRFLGAVTGSYFPADWSRSTARSATIRGRERTVIG